MGIEIPGELADLLNELGYVWPKSDETQMFELAQEWIGLAGRLGPIGQEASDAVGTMLADNTGPALTAFQAKWNDADSAVTVLRDGATGAYVLGGALMVCAGVVLVLKINVIIQLTILLVEIIEALATAPETFGGSLLEIPVFKKLTDMLINLLINQALEVVLG
jgi:hypothetical protein